MGTGKNQDHHCSFCGSIFKHKSQLEAHMRSHTRERPFTCDKCKRGFLHEGNLHEHLRYQHQNEKKYKCSLCPYETQRKSSLDRHILTHTNERNFPCQHPGCEYASKSSEQLQLHVIRKHENERKYLCPVPNCDYRGKTTIDMHGHSRKHSDSRPFVCDFKECKYQAKTNADLQCHKLGVHNGGLKPFACSMCDYRAPFKSSVKSHERTHANEKYVKCEFKGCSYCCTSKSYLRDHVLNCHTEKTLKCSVTGCLFSTARRTSLRKHEKRVHSENAYKCPHCQYRGADLSYMRLHVEKHSITRNHRIPCPNEGCTFQARNKRFLKRHLQFHDENISCPVQGCGYVGTSSSSSSWKYHLQAHDPTARPILCPLCPKYFPTNSELSSHLPSHTQERPFQCPECHFAASSKPTILKHMRIMHRAVSAKFDEESICDHCGVNYGCAVGLALHRIKLKTPVVVLRRLQLKFVM